jgi:transcriptional regulator with XRE-family HTH domain
MSDLLKLSQREAAAMLGMNARSLRDDGSIPRNQDGSYSGPELVKWARGRTESAKLLPDVDYEKLLLIADELGEPSESKAVAIVEILKTLRSNCGDSVFIELGEILLNRWERSAAWQVEYESDPVRQRRDIEAEKRERILRAKSDRLEIVAVCDECKKIRKGRKWVSVKPVDMPTIPAMCPDCLRGQ